MTTKKANSTLLIRNDRAFINPLAYLFSEFGVGQWRFAAAFAGIPGGSYKGIL
jgi:hypothetical protein